MSEDTPKTTDLHYLKHVFSGEHTSKYPSNALKKYTPICLNMELRPALGNACKSLIPSRQCNYHY